MLGNLAFSLSLYSGQMCTTPQNLLIPRDGIGTDAGEQVVRRGGRRPGRAPWASCSATTRAPTPCWARSSTSRCASASRRRPSLGEVALASRSVEQPGLPRRDGPHARHRQAGVGASRTPEAVYLLGVLRPGLLRRGRRLHGRRGGAAAPHGPGEGRDDGRRVHDVAGGRAPGRGRLPGRVRAALAQPHRRGVRQPDRRLLRLPRLRRQPGGQRGAVRRRVRRPTASVRWRCGGRPEHRAAPLARGTGRRPHTCVTCAGALTKCPLSGHRPA